MKIHISDQASEWYKKEMSLKQGDYVKFFVRYGGCSTVQSGFSLGVINEEPLDASVKAEKDGIVYYIEEKDSWYFDGHDLNVDFHPEANEPVFNYHKI